MAQRLNQYSKFCHVKNTATHDQYLDPTTDKPPTNLW